MLRPFPDPPPDLTHTIASPAAKPSAAQRDSKPLFVGRCGSATDTDVRARSGIPDLQPVSADARTCRWETPGTLTAVTFKWFRGSPLDDYRTTGNPGARTPVTVSGRTGYSWPAPHECETAVDTGGGDFITWTVTAPTSTEATACDTATTLVSATLTTR